ncbi:MAG: hypothetical protein ACRCX2_35715 [Paraclostridium sp.]
MIRLYRKSINEFIFTTGTVESILSNPIITSIEDDLEVYIYFPNRMIRVVDIETLVRANNFMISYLETSYYSGSSDGSFTIADPKSLEDEFPELFQVVQDEDSDELFNKLDKYLESVKLVSADHAVLNSPIELIDTLLFLKERPMYLYAREPQRDSLEFLISHMTLINKKTMRVYKIPSLDTLFELIFSKAILEEMDVIECR